MGDIFCCIVVPSLCCTVCYGFYGRLIQVFHCSVGGRLTAVFCHMFYCDLGGMLTSVFVIIMFHCSVGGMLTAVFVICFTAVWVM